MEFRNIPTALKLFQLIYHIYTFLKGIIISFQQLQQLLQQQTQANTETEEKLEGDKENN